MGVFGGITGMLIKEPSAKDILASVNKAVAQLTEEVNTKMDQMKGLIHFLESGRKCKMENVSDIGLGVEVSGRLVDY